MATKKKQAEEKILCHLDELYYITGDELNFILKEGATEKRKGSRIVGYYGRNPKGLQQLAERWFAEIGKDITAETIKEYVRIFGNEVELHAQTLAKRLIESGLN